MDNSIFKKVIVLVLLLNCVSNIGISEIYNLSYGSIFKGGVTISAEHPVSDPAQHATLHLTNREKDRIRYNYGSTRTSLNKSKLIAQGKARLNKNKSNKNKVEITFPKWMMMPVVFAKNSNEQLKRKYGVEVGLRDSLPVIGHSQNF